MRHQFPGFAGAVDLNEIDTVVIDQIGRRGFSVVIITKGGAKIPKQLVAANPTNMVEMWALRDEALKLQKYVERYARRRVLLAKFLPHFWTWLASVGATSWFTGYLGKLWAWALSFL